MTGNITTILTFMIFCCWICYVVIEGLGGGAMYFCWK